MTRREDMARRILDAALALVTEHGTDEHRGAIPMRWAKLGENYAIWYGSIGSEHRLDIWDGPVMLFVAAWIEGEEPELHGFTSGAWMEALLGPLDIGRECFAAERLANAFVEQWKRPAMTEAEAFRWGASLPDDRLRALGFSDRAEFHRIGEALIAFDEAEQSNTVLH